MLLHFLIKPLGKLLLSQLYLFHLPSDEGLDFILEFFKQNTCGFLEADHNFVIGN
jgi:hypothetical protein